MGEYEISVFNQEGELIISSPAYIEYRASGHKLDHEYRGLGGVAPITRRRLKMKSIKSKANRLHLFMNVALALVVSLLFTVVPISATVLTLQARDRDSTLTAFRDFLHNPRSFDMTELRYYDPHETWPLLRDSEVAGLFDFDGDGVPELLITYVLFDPETPFAVLSYTEQMEILFEGLIWGPVTGLMDGDGARWFEVAVDASDRAYLVLVQGTHRVNYENFAHSIEMVRAYMILVEREWQQVLETTVTFSISMYGQLTGDIYGYAYVIGERVSYDTLTNAIPCTGIKTNARTELSVAANGKLGI